MVDTMNSNAVRSDAIVTPCSRNSVRRRSASVVSAFSARSIVSRMREICERRASRFTAAASKRDARSSRSRSSSSCMRRFFSWLLALAASEPPSSCSAWVMSASSWESLARLSTRATRVRFRSSFNLSISRIGSCESKDDSCCVSVASAPVTSETRCGRSTSLTVSTPLPPKRSCRALIHALQTCRRNMLLLDSSGAPVCIFREQMAGDIVNSNLFLKS